MKTQAHKVDEVWKPGVRGYHEATGALILAQNSGRVLLQLRAPTSACPNTYGQFGGSVDGNEEIFQALKREIMEETGYEGPMVLRPLTPSVDPKKGFKYYNYVALVPFEFDPQINDESGGYKWSVHPHYPAPLHPGLKWLLSLPETQRTLAYLIEHRKYITR